MGTIFISHSYKDLPTPSEIVRGCAERDVLRSTDWLIRITEVVAACDTLVLLVSTDSIHPEQTTKELVDAFEFVDAPAIRPSSARSRLLHPEPLAK